MCDVLVVDDDPLVRATLSAILDGDGWTVREAARPAEALAIMTDADACRLMVADIDLGGGESGFGVAARVRQFHPELPVVFVSGRPDLLAAHPPGAGERVLAKPFRGDDLLRAVSDLLKRESEPVVAHACDIGQQA